LCEKLPYYNPRIDKCLRDKIKEINRSKYFITQSSCCGHGKYPTTIVVKSGFGNFFEWYSLTPLGKRKRYFYKKDEEGYYYIPEVIEFFKILGSFLILISSKFLPGMMA